MFKFVTIYRRVDDPEKLEAFFNQTHMQLAEQLPGLLKTEVSRTVGRPGGQSRYHLMYELYFADREAYEQAMAGSAVGLRLMEALRLWSDNQLITWFYADAFEEERPTA